MKILYLLFAFLFLAFLSEPGNAQRQCRRQGRACFRRCPKDYRNIGRWNCRHGRTCCQFLIGK